MEVTSAISFFACEILYRGELQPSAGAHQKRKFVYEHDVHQDFQFLTRIEDLPRNINVVRNNATRTAPLLIFLFNEVISGPKISLAFLKSLKVTGQLTIMFKLNTFSKS